MKLHPITMHYWLNRFLIHLVFGEKIVLDEKYGLAINLLLDGGK